MQTASAQKQLCWIAILLQNIHSLCVCIIWTWTNPQQFLIEHWKPRRYLTPKTELNERLDWTELYTRVSDELTIYFARAAALAFQKSICASTQDLRWAIKTFLSLVWYIYIYIMWTTYSKTFIAIVTRLQLYIYIYVYSSHGVSQ